MLEIRHLLQVIDTYRAATGVEDKTVSSRIFDDGKKVEALRNGAGLQVDRFNSAFSWLSDNWPNGAAWPSDVPRPSQHAVRDGVNGGSVSEAAE